MRCSAHKLFVAVLVLTACMPGLAQRTYNLGSAPPPDELKALDHVVGPAGKELPPGSGSAKEGATLFAQRCAACHGPNGTGGGVANRLVGKTPANAQKGDFKPTEKSATSYYPYATIAWDYINRAMPANKPGSLTPDEVYSLTAYLLFRNGIIQESDVMDAKSLPKVQMPNRNGFVPATPVFPPAPKPSWY
jgi:S-disulfanyl-L-cysteine oxidoreductase SoxD